MKILTNSPLARHVGGIGQYLSSFIRFVEKSKQKIRIVGVDAVPSEKQYKEPFVRREGPFSLYTHALTIPSIRDVMCGAQTLHDIEDEYEELMTAFDATIRRERPDAVLVNGTYYLPWSLLRAAQKHNLPVIVHYHGSLTKETAHWETRPRTLFHAMEKNFDAKTHYYVFPSQLAKETVEQEVFQHAIRRSSILPNPVPLHFFKEQSKPWKGRVGAIARWSPVKNPKFFEEFARYVKAEGLPMTMTLITDLARKSAARTRLSKWVQLRNPVSNERLGSFYSRVGVVVNPSLFETYGNVAQEAVASGTPALVNANMGVAETFRSIGLGQWVIDFSSMPRVCETARALSNEVVPTRVRSVLRAGYSPEKIYQQLLSLIRSI